MCDVIVFLIVTFPLAPKQEQLETPYSNGQDMGSSQSNDHSNRHRQGHPSSQCEYGISSVEHRCEPAATTDGAQRGAQDAQQIVHRAVASGTGENVKDLSDEYYTAGAEVITELSETDNDS